MSPGRNDPCPCGSGKKYKKCCQGKSADIPAPQAAAPTQSECVRLVDLFNAGAFAELEHAAHLMVPRYPDSGFIWKVLGAALQVQGKDALQATMKAAELLPNDAEAHTNLGNVRLSLGQLDEAVASWRRAITIKPGLADVHNNLGLTLRQLRQFDEAETSCRRALKIRPNFAEAHNGLGAVLQESGRLDEAMASYRRAITINPGYASAHNNLGIILQTLGQTGSAVDCFRSALKLKPDFAEAYNNLGATLKELGQLDEAMTCCRQALKLKPDYAEAHNNLGFILQNLGRLDDASANWRQALKLRPDYLEVRNNLVRTGKVQTDDENFLALVAMDESASSGKRAMLDKEKVILDFALGKCYEDIGDYEKAFPHFLDGCRLKRASLEYNPDSTAQLFTRITQAFDDGLIERLHGSGNPSRLPVFVLGMPRSGTTLIEQIISSHPEVYGAGELPDLLSIVQSNIANTGFPDNLRQLDPHGLAAWGTEYISRLQSRAPDKQRVTDKAPTNFLVLPLIHLMLPNAKIIHVRRNPVDTCLSCFTQLFSSGQNFSYDMTELGRYYADYFRMMQCWQNVLPEGAFLDVQYEDVVTDTETQSRRIIDYCGLDWNEACLEFYRSERAVQTASVTQVRQPIYKTSVERWRRYEAFLAPLLNALGELAA